MSKKIWASIGLLSLALLLPLKAQNINADLKKFNFNIGGGINTPLNPTGRYVGVSGDFLLGAGYNIDKSNSIIGEFGWTGLPSNIVLHPVTAPSGSINLYSLTVNYRYHHDRLGGSPFGLYAIMGGGWYYRHTAIDKNFVVPPDQACLPIYNWWGYDCSTGGVVSEQIASKGASAGGLNGGGGFTIRLSDTGWKFYVESRYNYAFSNRIPTTFVPVVFGLRYN